MALVALPTAAAAQDTTSDPDDLDRTFVPSQPGAGSSSGTDELDRASDELPRTGGGVALASGLALAAGSVLARRR